MNIEHDQDDVTIVKSTIELGHNLGLKVVAECIENKKTWNILKVMGCDYGQGYFMAKPYVCRQIARLGGAMVTQNCVGFDRR